MKQEENYKILHIIRYEKITKSVIETFKSLEVTSFFLVLTSAGVGQAASLEDTNVKVLEFNKKALREFFSTSSYQRVLLHSFDEQKAIIVNDFIPPFTDIIWITWGADIYDHPRIGNRIYLQKTYRLMMKQAPIKMMIKFILGKYRPYISKRFIEIAKAAQRLTGIATTTEGDYRNACMVYNIKPKRYPLQYYPLEKIMSRDMLTHRVRGKGNILVGNSGHETNNHIEVFEMLSQMDIGQRMVVVPLSYGNEAYIKKICQLGEEHFGKRFLPLIDFMPMHEYYEIIGKCDLVLMNQKRQQAVGNIVPSLYYGAMVFLRKENSLMEFFQSNNVMVYDLEDKAQLQEALYGSLPLEADINRESLRGLFSEEKINSLSANLLLN